MIPRPELCLLVQLLSLTASKISTIPLVIGGNGGILFLLGASPTQFTGVTPGMNPSRRAKSIRFHCLSFKSEPDAESDFQWLPLAFLGGSSRTWPRSDGEGRGCTLLTQLTQAGGSLSVKTGCLSKRYHLGSVTCCWAQCRTHWVRFPG